MFVQINGDDEEGQKKSSEDFGLEVAQIVITAATPMIEEPDQPFPQTEDPNVIREEDEEEEEEEPEEYEQKEEEEPAEKSPTLPIEEEEKSPTTENQPVDCTAQHVSSSTGSEAGDTTGPSTAENSVSHAPPAEDVSEPKQVVGGRASIPDELEPHQLACLQNLKESNA